MTYFYKAKQKTLLFNLIIFDFILLESSSKKVSNFFLEKFEAFNSRALQTSLLKLPVYDVVTSFKRFIKLLYFLRKNQLTSKRRIFNEKVTFTFIYECESVFESLETIFKQFDLECILNYQYSEKLLINRFFLNHIIILEHYFTKNDFLSFLSKKNFLFHAINTIEENFLDIYKIFSCLETDFKKLIFICLIIVSIFEK